MKLHPRSFAFTVVLGALSGLPPLSIDMGLPGLPALEAQFPDAGGRGALTLSLFLAGLAACPLFAGPLADRFGRKPVILTGLGLFTLAAGACAFASGFEALLIFRLLQGAAAGACVVLPVAMVRDLFEGNEARTKLSQVTTVLALAPLIAPVVGAGVMALGGWRAIFAVQAALGAAVLAAVALGVTETLKPGASRSIAPGSLLRAYRQVLTNRTFLTYTLIFSVGFAAMFTYISAAPAVIIGSLGLSEQAFAIVFGLSSGGLILGSAASGALSRRGVASRRVLMVGLVLMAVAGSAMLAVALAAGPRLAAVVGAGVLTIFSYGLIFPNATHEALQPLPDLAGSASGAARSIQMAIGASASALVAFLLPLAAPATVMAGLIAVLSWTGLGVFLAKRRP